MGIRIISVIIMLSLFLSSCALLRNHETPSFAAPTRNAPPPVEKPEVDATPWFAERVTQPELHAALVETLEPGKKFVEYNADKPFNPASLVKLTTTLVALKKLGADYRFPVKVFAGGRIEKGALSGDLYFAGGPPVFNEISAGIIADELKRRGIERVTGKIYVSPDFTFNFHEKPEESAKMLAQNLRLKSKNDAGVAERPLGTELFVFKSYPLRNVLLYMNTFSSNFVAHRVGDAVGGAEDVRQFLIKELGFSPEKIQLQTTSGLEVQTPSGLLENVMTAGEILEVLRAIADETKRQGLNPWDVLPLAAERSTLRNRLVETDLKNATIGKTGTLSASDGGIGMASFAGLIYTKNHGPVAYVMISEGAQTSVHKKLQDDFLKELLQGKVEPAPFDLETKRQLLPTTELQIAGSDS